MVRCESEREREGGRKEVKRKWGERERERRRREGRVREKKERGREGEGKREMITLNLTTLLLCKYQWSGLNGSILFIFAYSKNTFCLSTTFVHLPSLKETIINNWKTVNINNILWLNNCNLSNPIWGNKWSNARDTLPP